MQTFTEEKIQKLKIANERMNINDDKDRNTIIFVYCPPKVGSTTLVTSLRLSTQNNYIFHIHDELMLNVLSGVKDVTINEIIQYNKYLGKNVYVIDVYRSPIEHKMSHFFENISNYHFNNTDENVNNYAVENVICRFNKLFLHLTKKDYYRHVYDIPLQEDETFDFTKGYLSQEVNGIVYIKLRLIDSDKWSMILREILGVDVFIINDYETEKKTIKDIYKKFKTEYKIPIQYFETIENDKQLLFYYSVEERNKYLNDWRQRITNDIVVPYTEDEYIFYNVLSSENQIHNEIQGSHYIDLGCVCVACSFKREKLLEKIKRGEFVNEKVEHDIATQEYSLEIQKTKMKIIDVISKKLMDKKNEKKTAKQIIGGKFMSNIHGK
jgi:hypothetical protein